jgi:tryptophan synthase beta chain
VSGQPRTAAGRIDPGRFGAFGGRFASELLHPALAELAEAVDTVLRAPKFTAALESELRTWAGRPTPLTEVPRFSAATGLRVLLKREDLLHGGAHKTNNVIGQGLLAQFMGKERLIAETGAGQHGVATALVAARLGMPATVYMGARDIERQRVNVERMRLLGAEIIPVDTGLATLKDAINEALRDWASSVADTHYLLGTVCGPDPFPRLVRDLQAVIGREARAQWSEQVGGDPDAVIACVGGGSNAIGIFQGFVGQDDVRLFGVEPAGRGVATGHHGATLVAGAIGLLHGARTYVLQDRDGQIGESHSMAAGLDYPGVGPEHAFLKDTGRAEYLAVTDDAALAAFEELSRCEGIIPAFESAHALAFASQAVAAGHLPAGARVLVNVSGRGDKDLDTYFRRQKA